LKKTLIIVAVALLAVGVMAFRPAVAAAEEMEGPGHGMNTVQSLAMCVEHAASMGAITEAGVANSLLAKVAAAQAAVDRGQPAVAVDILQAFIYEVQAQAGVHIEAEHAQHMIAHAEQVIAALQQ
jgi:glycerol-3-phosphate O-acyltransferase